MKAPAILPQGFYVYTHHRATTGEIFYVGKGKGGRAWDSYGRSRHWKSIYSRHGVTVTIYAECETESEAFEIESLVIAQHGRLDIGTGILINKTDGGEGVAGRSMPKSEIAMRSAAAKKIFEKDGMREKYGAAAKLSHSRKSVRLKLATITAESWKDESIAKARSEGIAKSWVNGKESRIAALKLAMSKPEERLRKSKAAKKYMRENKAKRVYSKELGICFMVMADAVSYLRENGWPKAKAANICWCCKGNIKAAYGFTWQYA